MRNLLAGAVVALILAGCAHVAEPPPPTDAELNAYIQLQQDAQWSQLGATGSERPEVTSQLVSWEEYTRSSYGCQQGSQIAIVDSQSGAVSVRMTVPDTAQFVCATAQVLYPDEIDYFTVAQLDFLYDYYRDVLVPCLEMQGLVVTYAPTREQFAASAGFASWDPYTQLGADLPPSRADEITQRCPALPKAQFLEPR